MTCISYILWRKADEAEAAGGQLLSTSCQCRLTVIISFRGRGREGLGWILSTPSPAATPSFMLHFSTESALFLHTSIPSSTLIYQVCICSFLSVVKLSPHFFSDGLHLHQSLPLFLVNSHYNIPRKKEVEFVKGVGDKRLDTFLTSSWMCWFQICGKERWPSPFSVYYRASFFYRLYPATSTRNRCG